LVFGIWCFAQTPLRDLIFTVGTTIRTGGNDYSYVLIDTPTPELLSGKRFAVFGKAGAPDSAALFTQRGSIFVRSDAAEIDALLNASIPLGQDLSTLADGLNLLLRREGVDALPLAQKILTAFRVAGTNAHIASALRLMARANPGLSLAMGRAFTEQSNEVTTYEVRETTIGGAPGDVVGRVTITNNLPIVLPRPGRAFQVMSNHPTDDLKIRLRWGATDQLRRLSLASYGYNLWRMSRAQAEALGFHTTIPTVAQLLGTPGFVRVNDAPIHPTKDFPANTFDGSDRITSFFTDDNNAPDPGGVPFNDGDEFYYYVTARDILGRDGVPAKGGFARACRRIPPSAPTEVKVQDKPLVLNDTNVIQRLQISWRQNTNTNETVTEYWIYRWPNPTMLFSNDVVPLSNRVGVVTHVPGPNVNSFFDDGSGGPTTPGLNVYWYSVRAVHQAACDPLLSPHSAPASGVLRQRDGPEAAEGSVVGSCGAPAVTYLGFARDTDDTNRVATRWHYRLMCERRDKGIAWAQFIVTDSFGEQEVLSPIYFSSAADVLDFDYSMHIDREERYVTNIACVVGSAPDKPSRAANAGFDVAPGNPQRFHARFRAGTVLLTAANPSDPLVASLSTRFPPGACYPANNVEADPSGVVTMRFDVTAPYPPMIVQANTNNGTNWINVGTATPDSNGVYAVSYPNCLIGPLPAFRGCVIDVPVAETDCPEHITGTSAADGVVAPVHVKFRLKPRTREYRLYRQVNDGALALISQGAARFNSFKPNLQITVPDDAMPPSVARLCYYVQLLDEHGNGSPLALLGCKEAGPETPPKPVLAEPIPAGTVARPQVTLNWFCPTAGVSRFQFMIKRVDDEKAPSGFAHDSLTRARIYDLQVKPLFQLNFLTELKISDVSGIHYTPKLSAGFGPGPQFTITADVFANVPYEITVASVNAKGDRHTDSITWPFTWIPPEPRVIVPWPARPLPPVRSFDSLSSGMREVDYGPRVAAVLFTNAFDGGLEDGRFPVGVRIGEFTQDVDADTNVGGTNHVRFYPQTSATADPTLYAFRRRSSDPSRNGQALLPIVVYRQQVTNAEFPQVSSDLVQVSPLIDRIPYRRGQFDTYIMDGLIASRYESYNDHDFNLMYVRDQQPVVRNARYRYFLARFNAKREVEEIIPAGEVEIRYNP